MMTCNEQVLRKQISEAEFVCVELQLYLDTHPEDCDAKADYVSYGKRLNALIAEYEDKYGPLLGFGHSATPVGCWVNSEWPWQQ